MATPLSGSSPVSDRMLRVRQATATLFRTAARERDLGHPEACDFVTGNPQEPALPEFVTAVREAVAPRSPSWYAYGPPWQGAIEAAAAGLGARLDLALEPADLLLTRGASSGLAVVLRTVLDPGDEVVYLTPPFLAYEAQIVSELGEPVRVPLVPGTFDLDPEAIRGAITPRTRALLLNTPHNPSGRLFPEDQLRAVADVLEEASRANGRRIYLVSDEAFARMLFDGRRMLTPARFYPATFMIHTYSKTLLAPAQRLGYLAMPPSMPDREELRFALMLSSFTGGATPDAVMQRALPALERLIIDVPALQRRRDRMVEALRGLGYEVAVPEATLFLIPRSPVPDAVEFCDWLAERHVFAMPGDAFELPGHFRLSLTATDAMVDRALPVFAQALTAFRERV